MSQKSAQTSAQQEPSMEEILASIRRIISDDEVPAQNTEAPTVKETQSKNTPVAQKPVIKKEEVKQAMASKEKEIKKDFPSFNEDDLLELTEMVDDSQDEVVMELDDIVEPVVEEKPKPKQAPVLQEVPLPVQSVIEKQPKEQQMSKSKDTLAQNNEDHLISDEVEENSRASLNELFTAVSKVNYSLGRGEKTLEDIVVDSLKPLLKQWIDQHLAGTVEKIVREEVERIVKKLEQK
ncbi:MAG: DUF2497 domain-containing protein [Alphaproteobacteria bacterium]|nr:DUF2497 domain-containing protein [Alphaproteobacteria bacterium]